MIRRVQSPSARVRSVTARDRWVELLLFVAVVGLAAAVRVIQLATPHDLIFDEIYYAQDACSYLGWGANVCGVASEVSWVHPPLGKWFIAAGIWIFGNNSVGWRVAPALAGIVTVALVYLLARRLTGSRLAGLVASAVAALDPLSIISSRVAMLDAFTTCAGVALLLFAVADRDSVLRTGADASDRTWRRPWLAAAGVAGGIAVATKWSGGLVLAAAVLLVLAWGVAAGLRTGRSITRSLVTAGPTVLLWLVVVPGLIYTLSYVGRVHGPILAVPWAEDAWIRQFLHRQLSMLRFHAGLADTHPYASPAWSWLLDKRPVVFFFGVDAAGRYREILAAANPLLYVPGFAAAAVAAVLAVRRRGWWDAELVVAAGVAAAFLPWLALSASRSFIFLYYLLPTVPFLAVALGWAAATLPGRAGRGFGAATLVVAVAVAAFWAPFVYAAPLDYATWRTRILLTDCGPLPLTNGRLAPRPGGGEPPPGWCWI